MQGKIMSFVYEIARSTIEGSLVDAGKKLGGKYGDEKAKEQSVEKALEGEASELVKEQLGELAAALQAEVEEPQTGYRDRDLRRIFEEQYKRFGVEDTEGKEALWQRFLICCKGYLAHMTEDSSYAERMLLRNTGDIRDDVEEIRKGMEAYSQSYEKERIRGIMPQVELDSGQDIVIRQYDPGALPYGARIILDRTEDRYYDCPEEENIYTITVPFRNTGDTEIHHMECTHFEMSLCGENSCEEEGYVNCLDVVRHEQGAGCNVSISPSCTQKVQFIVTWDEDVDDEEAARDYNRGVLLFYMQLTVTGEEGQQKEKKLEGFLKKQGDVGKTAREIFMGRYRLVEGDEEE